MANLSKNEKILKELLEMWLKENDFLRQINHELYTHTELYEHGYEKNFDTNLHNFFAKKITRFNKERNELYLLISDKIKKAWAEERRK